MAWDAIHLELGENSVTVSSGNNIRLRWRTHDPAKLFRPSHGAGVLLEVIRGILSLIALECNHVGPRV